MKKIYLLISFIVLMVLSSCSTKEIQPGELVESPENNQPPLSGKWKVEKTIEGPYKRGSTEKTTNISDIEALFHKSAVIVGNDYVLEPLYKTRNININDYLFYNYKIDLDYLGISPEEENIITVTGDEGYFNEFVKYSEDEMVFFYDDKFVFLKRQVEEVNEEEIRRYIDVEKNISRNSKIQESYTLNSGLLLGIKSNYYDEENKVNNWEYDTIWIKASNREISSIYKVGGLLLPRKRGFWLVDVEREKNNQNIRDKILAEEKGKFKEITDNRMTTSISNMFSSSIAGEYLSLLKHILYVGNDYVSVEEINPATNRKNLRVYPIDYLEEENPTMISDLIDKEEFYESIKLNVKSQEDNTVEEKSFGIDRRNGHWIMKGRINYIDNKEELYKDFNIKAIPPKEIVHYDELVVPWSLIKSRFPEAIDAFTSPNEDIIVVITREDISIYPLRDGDILQDKLGNIDLNTNQTIIMAEWGMGKYANLWEQEMLKNEPIELEY